MTRLLLINPNISDSVSALIRAEAERSFAPPPVKPHRGLPESVARLLERR